MAGPRRRATCVATCPGSRSSGSSRPALAGGRRDPRLRRRLRVHEALGTAHRVRTDRRRGLTGVLNLVFGRMLDMASLPGWLHGEVRRRRPARALRGSRPPRRVRRGRGDAAALRDVSREPTSVGRLRLGASIGVHTDDVLLFRVGSSHGELVVAGPAASTTARMEKTARTGEIVISAATRAALPVGSAVSPRATDGCSDGDGRRSCRPGPCRGAPTTVARYAPARGVASTSPPATSSPSTASPTSPSSGSPDSTPAGRRGPDAGWGALDEVVTAVQTAVDGEGVTLLASDVDDDGG